MSPPSRTTGAAAAITALLLTRDVAACPFCHSNISQLVWDGIFNDCFASNMVMSLAPFALFAVAGVWLHGRDGAWEKARQA